MKLQSFDYFVLNVKMSLMHVFTEKFMEEQEAAAEGRRLTESFDQFVTRHSVSLQQMAGLTDQHRKLIDQAVEETKQESQLHVIIMGNVIQEGMGRQMDTIMILTQFWEDNFQDAV